MLNYQGWPLRWISLYILSTYTKLCIRSTCIAYVMEYNNSYVTGLTKVELNRCFISTASVRSYDGHVIHSVVL